ncbi:MAG: CPBP family intramembrane glutamic endopeptidase [Microthrixaceae bacterium]
MRDAGVLVLVVQVVGVFAGALAFSLWGHAGGEGTASSTLPIGAQVAGLLPFWVAAVGGAVLLARRHGDPIAQLGFRIRPLDVPLGVVVGLAVQWVVIPILYWPIFRFTDLRAADLEEPAKALARTAPGFGGAVLFVLMAVFCAPIAEETLYRGVLQRSANRPNAAVGVVVAAVVFALMHFQGVQLLGLVVFGMASGILVERTGRLAPGVVAHMAFNAATVFALLARR